MDNYVRIHLTSQPTLTSQMSLKTLQELLPEEKFIRVHKSFVVPIYRIASYTSKEILLYNGIKIPVGRSYSKYLKDKNSKWHKIQDINKIKQKKRSAEKSFHLILQSNSNNLEKSK